MEAYTGNEHAKLKAWAPNSRHKKGRGKHGNVTAIGNAYITILLLPYVIVNTVFIKD